MHIFIHIFMYYHTYKYVQICSSTLLSLVKCSSLEHITVYHNCSTFFAYYMQMLEFYSHTEWIEKLRLRIFNCHQGKNFPLNWTQISGSVGGRFTVRARRKLKSKSIFFGLQVTLVFLFFSFSLLHYTLSMGLS